MLNLEKIPLLLAVLSSTSLIAGVVFDIGYFSSVGFEYVYYLSIEDHVESAIIWAPTIIFTAFGIYFSGFSDSVHGRVEVLTDVKPTRFRRAVASLFSKIPLVIGSFSLVLAGVISSAAYGSQDFSVLLVMAGMFLVFLVVRAVVSHFRFSIFVPKVPMYAAGVLCAGFCLFYLGIYWGIKDIEKARSNPSDFELIENKSALLGVVRPISEGVVVFDTKKEVVSMLRSETIVSVSTPKMRAPVVSTLPDSFRDLFKQVWEK